MNFSIAPGPASGVRTMRLLPLAALIAFVAGSATAVEAREFQYECTVDQVLHIDKGGGQVQSKDPRIGERFTISRETGEIVGSPAYRLNRGQGWKTLSVLDRGSKQQSFKVLAISQPTPYTNVLYIEVREYDSGPEKAFMYYNNFAVTEGVCR